MALDLNTIYQNLLGRPVDAAGQTHWTNDYNNYIGQNISHDDAVNKIKSNIKLHDEHTVHDILSNNPGIVQTIDDYDLHGLSNDSYVDEAKWGSMMGNFSNIQESFKTLQETLAQNQKDMMDMYGSGPWGGGGYGQTVGGVKTGNELPGWTPKTGGSSGFFGRGGNRFGLTTGSLNI